MNPEPSAPKAQPRGKRAKPAKDSGNVREEIVAVALESFSRNGFEATSITRIAKDAGVAAPLVYYYFADKDALWQAAVDTLLANLQVMFRDAERELGGVDPLTQLKIMWRKFIYFSFRYPQTSRLLLNESLGDGVRLHWIVDHYLGPVVTAWRRAINDAIGRKLLKPLDPAMLMMFLVGGIVHVVNGNKLTSDLFGLKMNSDAEIEAFAEFVVDTMLAGALARREDVD